MVFGYDLKRSGRSLNDIVRRCELRGKAISRHYIFNVLVQIFPIGI